jgi:hypothetical protein
MRPLFSVNCSTQLAIALGAMPMMRLSRPDLSFPVYQRPATHHAELRTKDGLFAWLWFLDNHHRTITRMENGDS